MNQTTENLTENNVSASVSETMQKEILAAVDEKFDIEAVAQMVEQREFSNRLTVSLQKSFQSLQSDLQYKEQMIQNLQGRLNNLELDIALIKRTIVSPYPFAHNPQPVQIQTCPKVVTPTKTEQLPAENKTSDNRQDIRPPDFSKLRAMTVPEPANKFIPPQKTEQKTV